LSGTTALNVGFLTVLHEPNGFLGGYLVTNQWGRPLEFRLSTAVQPNRVQHILYAGTLEPYICADLIGKTLMDKTSVTVQLVVTETPAVLDLRQRVDVPVLYLSPAEKQAGDALGVSSLVSGSGPFNQSLLRCHARFPEDTPLCRELLERLTGITDLAEPFARIREAIGEARKMGVTGRSTSAAA
jgi:hypothetical protein